MKLLSILQFYFEKKMPTPKIFAMSNLHLAKSDFYEEGKSMALYKITLVPLGYKGRYNLVKNFIRAHSAEVVRNHYTTILPFPEIDIIVEPENIK